MKVGLMIILILIVMYTGLAVYFEHRLEKKNKEWQEKLKRTHNLKKN